MLKKTVYKTLYSSPSYRSHGKDRQCPQCPFLWLCRPHERFLAFSRSSQPPPYLSIPLYCCSLHPHFSASLLNDAFSSPRSHLFLSCRRRAGCSCRARRSTCRSRARSSPRSPLHRQRSCPAGFDASSHIAAHTQQQSHTQTRQIEVKMKFSPLYSKYKIFRKQITDHTGIPFKTLFNVLSCFQFCLVFLYSSPGPSCRSTESRPPRFDRLTRSRCCRGSDLSMR